MYPLQLCWKISYEILLARDWILLVNLEPICWGPAWKWNRNRFSADWRPQCPGMSRMERFGGHIVQRLIILVLIINRQILLNIVIYQSGWKGLAKTDNYDINHLDHQHTDITQYFGVSIKMEIFGIDIAQNWWAKRHQSRRSTWNKITNAERKLISERSSWNKITNAERKLISGRSSLNTLTTTRTTRMKGS